MGLGNLGEKLARIGRDTKNGVQKMSDSVTIKSRITAEKRSLERLFAVIGESVYKENPDAPKSGLEDEYAAVKVAYANIEKFSRQLDQVNGIVYCPNCGKPADPGDKFCAKCGARLLPEEGTPSRVAQDFREVGSEVGKIAKSSADRTGEFFGSAAAKTKNGFSGLRDKGRKLFEGASRKMGRRKEEQAEQDGPAEEERDDWAEEEAPDIIEETGELKPEETPEAARPEETPEAARLEETSEAVKSEEPAGPEEAEDPAAPADTETTENTGD